MSHSNSGHVPTDATQPFARPSSQGDSPVVVTPKDVAPDAATAQDITERKLNSENLEVSQEALLDDAIELSFPASDPIAVPSYNKARERSEAARRK